MIKIAFFDVDGTLLKMGGKEPSKKTISTLKQLQKKGILLCMATGRSYPVIPNFEGIDFDVLLTFNGSYVRNKKEVIFKNPLDGILLCMATGRSYPVIPNFEGIDFDVLLTFNGSYVRNKKEVIFKNPLDNDDKNIIIQNLKNMNRAIAISNEKWIVTNGIDKDLEQYFAFGNVEIIISKEFDMLCKENVYQIMCSCKKDEYMDILQGTHNTQITAWWDKAVDIIPINCGKGNAVNAILDYYGFSKDEAIAFGDGENDVEMLEAVGTGIAMGNAKDEVKAKADFVCQSVENDGIYHYCLDNNLINNNDD